MRWINIAVIIFWVVPLVQGCTTAVFSGKATEDGRPILWKNRDTGEENNQVFYFTDGVYSYYGLVNGGDRAGLNIWAGMNETGFAIMNSASYNVELKGYDKDGEGRFMKLALQTCKTVNDFEKLLKKTEFYRDVNANFGVIDGVGGAVIFETNGKEYRKLDAEDVDQAPDGYIVRTNYSEMGIKENGFGYIRKERADQLISNIVTESKMSVKKLITHVARDLINPRTGVSPQTQKGQPHHYLLANDTINRYSTASCSVFHGVTDDMNPDNAEYWISLGMPVCSVAVPLFNGSRQVPEFLSGEETSSFCDTALALKKKVFPYKKGYGTLEKYLDADSLMGHNRVPSIYDETLTIQKQIFSKANDFLKEKHSKEQIQDFQNTLTEIAYLKLKLLTERCK